MKKILILMLCLAATTFSQNREETESTARINPEKPTVYLSYVCQDEKKIHLRMNNNTIWHVYVEVDKSYFPTKKPIQLQNGAKVYAIPNNEKIPVFYYAERDQLEDVKGIKIPKLEYHFTNGGGWLASNDSILFSVPIELLRKGLKIYVEFFYEWEMAKSGDTRKEPEHRVYFRGADIGSLNTGIKATACQK
ncbi:MAG TPA: hypothetical protein PKC65_03330 [Pyrinomonadaceae bacterium]|nr:hypothetical protein [Pyrinomonadaceae bacterium]